MKIGISLPHSGQLASPELIVQAAKRAESLGYDSVWTYERLLAPLKPRTPYPATADGSLPGGMKRVFDPLTTLTYVAAHTSKLELGVSVLDIPFYNPVVLARQLTAIDVFSGGRLKVGMGLGWSADEYEATGADSKTRGARADEFLQCLKAVWSNDPVSFHGRFFNVAESVVQPKPVQKPHPPIYLAAYDPRAMNRIARLADGWNPTGIPADGMSQMMAGIRQMASAAGRDAAQLKMLVRANVYLSEHPLAEDRWIFTGSWEQIRQDVAATRAIGADELFFDIQFDPAAQTPEACLAWMDKFRALA